MAENDNHSPNGPATHAPHGAHVTPVPALIGVWLALMVLTAATVAAVYIDLGSVNLWIAMGIASVKATLVALFFMHLWYDRTFNLLVFVVSFLFVTLFVGLALMDTMEYQPEVQQRIEAIESE